MMKIKRFPILLFAWLPFVVACSGSLPKGMPKLVPCQVTVTQEGVPVANVFVSFNPSNQSHTGGFVINGMTDETGTLIVQMQGKYKGMPEGDYVVTLSKIETSGDPLTDRNNYKKFSLIAPEYMAKDTTPLRLTVTSDPVNETWDVGKAGRFDLKGMKRSAKPL